jgi:hypothetical protein
VFYYSNSSIGFKNCWISADQEKKEKKKMHEWCMVSQKTSRCTDEMAHEAKTTIIADKEKN